MIYGAALFLSAAMHAQDLDPTVEVSRVYEGKLIEVRKPVIEMAVPDTLYRFDLDFDYSVFDSPYRGSYEFNPYMLDMRPESDLSKPSVFYLRAGAGYTLHPTLDILWSPDIKGLFSVNVYGTHRSYVGRYRAVGGNRGFEGYDLLSKAGADFGYDWKKASLNFGAYYHGLAVKGPAKVHSYNALDAHASLRSKSLGPEHFMYRVDAAYRYAGDNASVTGHDFALDASFGPSFNKNNKVFFDLGVALNSYSGAMETVMTRFYIVPHYIYDKGRIHLDLGFRLSAAMKSGGFRRNQIIYPDLKMDLAVIPSAMRLFLNVGGGEKLISYAGLLEKNHHVDLSYGTGSPQSLVSPSVERVNVQLGLEGRISGFVSYLLRGGYVNIAYAPLAAVVRNQEGRYLPYVGYSSYQKAYAALDWDMNFRSVRFDGTVEYVHSWDMASGNVLLPARVTADARLMYNWRKRLYVGADCLFSSARTNSVGAVVAPWYTDLGVSAEYAFNRKLSAWIRGGNLLDMEIQRDILYAEKGISFTAGISLVF